MNQDIVTLLDIVKKHYPDVDNGAIPRAYEFAKQAHEGQFRASGRPHIDHAMGTAKLLASWRMPVYIVVAGILHDITEDTPYTLQYLETRFGEDVANIVEGETKISTLKYRGRERYAENLRKMFFAIAKDARVVIVKFADRIDNLKTLDFFPEEKQQRIANETLEIYAPIANRLGMGAIRGELEDLAFKYINPKDYDRTLELLVERAPLKESCFEKTKVILEKELKNAGIKCLDMHGRIKHLYSLYKKILEKGDISQIYDIVAQRIIVPNVSDCYAALGVIHHLWKPLKGRIKDYIAQPKPNGYQSIQTTVFCEEGEIVEFQIRTPQMHEEAEYGIAAHWFYAEKGKKSVMPDKHTAWLKELAELQKNIQDRKKFLEAVDSLKMDFFKNRIFIFTPKGDVIDLPESSTPIDFAYAIHSELGDKCAGARINDAMGQLSSTLRSGDMVEIIVDKNRQGPSPYWLDSVKTARARTKIRESAKKNKLSGWLREIMHKTKR